METTRVVCLALLALAAVCSAAPSPSSYTSYEVTLLVFSSEQDPTWTIGGAQVEELKLKAMMDGGMMQQGTTRVMGYRGFVLTDENGMTSHVAGMPVTERFLMTTAPSDLPDAVRAHVFEQLVQDLTTSDKDQCAAGAICGVGNKFVQPCCHGHVCQYEGDVGRCVDERFGDVPLPKKVDLMSFLRGAQPAGDACDDAPIVGPDTPPKFEVSSDDEGCFVEKQYANNCYDYGNDIVTNTFAQPGRGTGQKWSANTCEDIRASAERDGLEWIGQELPSDQPETGHYIALFIWPNTNFHWVRKDVDGYWSHKPGGTPVKNVDNSGQKISDPAKSDFSPWSQFCGYMHTVPSKVTIE